jgi:murein DD-endopeptidase MepM/ murein hydrolase activator NlpD
MARFSAPDHKEVTLLMPYPRSKTRSLVTAVTALAVATPAIAAGAQSAQPADALRIVSPGSPAAMAVREADLAREERLRKAARKERRDSGPFVPVVGKIDYGTSENAFGAARYGHVHSGHDMFAPTGTPIVAVTEGIIADAGSDGGQGNYVHLYDPASEQTYIYMHMAEPSQFETGEKVEAGVELGGVGCTGSCSGDHLHFEIRDGKGMTGEALDPLPALKRWEPIEKPLD